MKTPLFMLSAAAFTLAAGASSAATAPDVLQAYLRDAGAQADSQLAAVGVDRAARTGIVQAYVGGDGRLKAIRIISAESPCAGDRDVTQAMRGVELNDVPPELIDAKLTFALGEGGAAPAKAR